MNNGYNNNPNRPKGQMPRNIPNQGQPQRPVQDPRMAQRQPQRPVQDPRMTQRQPQRPVQDPRMAQSSQRPRMQDPRMMPQNGQQNRMQRPMPSEQNVRMNNASYDPRRMQARQMPRSADEVRTSEPRVTGEYGDSQQTRSLASTRRKATRAQMRQDRRRRRREAVKLFFGRLAVYAVILLIIGAVVAGVFFWKFYNVSDSTESDVTYVVNYTGNETVKNKVSGDVAYQNGALYVNFTNIAEGCGMSVVSGDQTMKFVIPDGGDTSDAAGTGHEEYVVFANDSTECNVCGQAARLAVPAVFKDKNVWIPADFVRDYVNGITVEEDTDKKMVYIFRDKIEGVTGDEASALAEVSFKLKAVTAPEPAVPDEDLPTTGGMPEVTFSTDLSAYEEYMNPADASEYLVLVNKVTAVDASFKPADLTDVVDTRKDGRKTQQMRECAAKALEAMFKEMRAAGYTDVSVTSAYRSYEYQEELYNGYVASKGQEEADKISARPGTSEHQTGLCADLHNLSGADESFKNQAAYTWLSENAWKFGFIIRFPENKTEITGYFFEPWHYRFVGRNAAWQIYNSGICLEEFLAR